MLKSLKIKNFALIRELEIQFNEGFSTITGETGAGKSIILGAIALLLGQRADSSALQDKNRKCVIEASFLIATYNLKTFFEVNNLDYDDETLIRREILESGKSRAFINDVPVNLVILKELGDQLIDIHSQHQNLLLNRSDFQLNFVDILAGTGDLLLEYREAFKTYHSFLQHLQELKERAAKESDEFDYLSHQVQELDQAKLQQDELESLEQELQMLTHAEEIKTHLSAAGDLLIESEFNVVNITKEILQHVSQISAYSHPSKDITERLQNVMVELKDMAREIASIEERTEFDPERIAHVKQRIDLLYSLMHKHRKNSIPELMQLHEQISHKVGEILHFDEAILALEKELATSHAKLAAVERQLSQKRHSITSKTEDAICNVLTSLGIPYARFKIQISEMDDYSSNGRDSIIFLFSANKNTELQNLDKVASGGEISRVMMALKYLVSSSSGLPAIIFDEIDSGVSGEIADKMANLMKHMSEQMQVISITHLPQIASKGQFHYRVLKTEDDHSSYTEIQLLNVQERIREIAKMLSGENLTEAAFENARILLKTN